MSNVNHADIVPGSASGVHIPLRWPAFANATARLAQSVTSADISGVAYQSDTKQLYFLADTSPTWKMVFTDVDLAAQPSGNLWTSSGYSTTIPLTGNKYMPQTIISTPTTFTAGSSPVAGGQCTLLLVADGTNAPVFSGMLEFGGSAGYNNTSGIINYVTIWYDGSTVWYSVNQAVNAVALDIVAPSIKYAYVAPGALTTLSLLYSENLNASFTPATGDFTISNSGGTDTVSAVSISGNTINLTKSRTTLTTDVITVSYTPGTNKIQDAAGNISASLSARAVMNEIGFTFSMGTLNGNTYNSSTGVYTWSSGALTAAYCGLSSKTLPASTNGWFQMLVMANGQSSCAMYIAESSTAIPFSNAGAKYGIYMDPGTLAWKMIVNGSGALTPNVLSNEPAAPGDLMRVRRATTTWYGEVSHDGGVTWLTVDSRAGDANQLWLNIAQTSSGPTSQMGMLTGSGLA